MDYSKLYGNLLETELIQHFNKLEDICKNIGERVEGGCFTFDKHVHIRPSALLSKQVNLFLISLKSNNIMEIGFNAGHSCLIYLFSNKNSKITLFDICEHKYTQPCFDYLDNLFPGRLTLIKGDSTETIPKFRRDNPNTKFDFHKLQEAIKCYYKIRVTMIYLLYFPTNDILSKIVPQFCGKRHKNKF